VGFPHVTLRIHKPAFLSFQNQLIQSAYCIINAIKYMKTVTWFISIPKMKEFKAHHSLSTTSMHKEIKTAIQAHSKSFNFPTDRME